MENEEQLTNLQEELNKVLEREDLFSQGYKPKQRVQVTGELFSKLMGTLGEQQKEIGHLRKAMGAINHFLDCMETTNSSLALDVLKIHSKNIDKGVTHSTEKKD